MNGLVTFDPTMRYPAVPELATVLAPDKVEIAYAYCNRRAMHLLIDKGALRYRNPRFVWNGMIDVEIDHPLWGWVLFSASPDDVETYGRRIFWSLFGIAEKFYGEIPEQYRFSYDGPGGQDAFV